MICTKCKLETSQENMVGDFCRECDPIGWRMRELARTPLVQQPPLPPRPSDVPEHASYLYAAFEPDQEPRGCWWWYENPNETRDPRTIRMAHIHPALQADWEIRMLSVPYLVPKSLPK